MHSQIPRYFQNRLQRLQNCSTGYGLGKYANTLNVINLNWLPVAENTEFIVSKLAYQGLHDKNWPEYLPIKLIEQRRNLWLDTPRPLIDFGERNTFQQQANEVFNTLPVNIRICANNKSFINKARSFYKDKALAGICPCKSFPIFFSFDLFAANEL